MPEWSRANAMPSSHWHEKCCSGPRLAVGKQSACQRKRNAHNALSVARKLLRRTHRSRVRWHPYFSCGIGVALECKRIGPVGDFLDRVGQAMSNPEKTGCGLAQSLLGIWSEPKAMQ